MDNFVLADSPNHLIPVGTFPLRKLDEECIGIRCESDPTYLANDLPDFVGDLANLKQLLRMVSETTSDDAVSGDSLAMLVHRLGSCIVFDHAVDSVVDGTGYPSDELVDMNDALVLLPTDLLEDISEHADPVMSRSSKAVAGVAIKNTFIHVDDGSPSAGASVSMNRVHSAPPRIGPEKVMTHQSSGVGSSLTVTAPSVESGRQVALEICSAGDWRSDLLEKHIQSIQTTIAPILDSVDCGTLSPLSRSKKAVEWSIAGFSVLLGCDIVFLDDASSVGRPHSLVNPSKNQFSSLKRITSITPSKRDRIESWFENNLLQLDNVGWINRNDVLSTANTHSLVLPTDVDSWLDEIHRILRFLSSACTKQGATYCLIKDTENSVIQLFDVSELSDGWNKSFAPSDRLKEPIAKLCLDLVTRPTTGSLTVPEQIQLLKKALILISSDEDPNSEKNIALFVPIARRLADLLGTDNEAVELLLKSLVAQWDEEWAVVLVEKILRRTQKNMHAKNDSVELQLEGLAWLMAADHILTLVSAERVQVESLHLQKLLSTSVAESVLLLAANHAKLFQYCEKLQPSFTLLECLKDRSLLLALMGKKSGLNQDASSIRLSLSCSRETLLRELSNLVDSLGCIPKQLLASVHNELGNAFVTVETSGLPGTELMSSACIEFSTALESAAQTSIESTIPIVLNISRMFKLWALQLPIADSHRFALRMQSIGCVRLVDKVMRSGARLKGGSRPHIDTASITAAELVDIASDLISLAERDSTGTFAKITDNELSYDRLVAALVQLSREVKVSDKYLPGLATIRILLGQMEWSATDFANINEVPTLQLSRACLDVVPSVTKGPTSDRLLSSVEYQLTKIGVLSQNRKDAERHIAKCLQLCNGKENMLDIYIQAVCLKATILYNADKPNDAVDTLIAELNKPLNSEAARVIRECLKELCETEFKNHKSDRIQNIKTTLGGIYKGAI